MAIRYFDTDGTTPGFGTLTGALNGAFWTTSTAGTSATSTYTFTSADEMIFGAGSTTATAGTATVPSGVTITLNKLTLQGTALTGLQTIAGPGALAFAGTTPTITCGTTGGLTITAQLTGSVGFTVAGADILTLQPAADTNTYTGATSISAASTVHVTPFASPATAGQGRVFGQSAVTVSGTLKTKLNATTRGQMRYGNGSNTLTFGAASKLYPGGF